MALLSPGRRGRRRAGAPLGPAALALVVGGAVVAGLVARPRGARAQPLTARIQPVDQSLEYRVKAAYLLNFTRYVEWPAGAFPTPETPLELCVYGVDPFGAILDDAVAGRTTQGRPIRVRRTDAAAVARRCHLVFVSYAQWRRQPDVLAALDARGVLTVGESEAFAEAGGVIGFVVEQRAVRFAVNLAARDDARLRISSRMLSLAARVIAPEREARR